ncbi:MAG TPA: amidophosphoribosyltransferase [Candidatus Paceibacterota bacterium]|nr:amidophosphoribosyltransferase [Candidatus Paceibacterota bacterium]
MRSLNEKCAVFGIYGKDIDVARLSFFGLFALQHRGQEGSGIAVSDGETIRYHKDHGLVAQVFTEEAISSLNGYMAVGHNRYSTSKGSGTEHVQPMIVGDLAFVHNGNLPSTKALEVFLSDKGVEVTNLTDSCLMAHAISWHMGQGMTLADAVVASYPLFTGAFSIIAMTKTEMVAARDPKGIRPLTLARLQGGFVVTSETCALGTVGATFERDIEPGEMILINQDGITATQVAPGDPKLDIFEFIYFARHDSELMGKSVYEVRKNFGKTLAREYPVDADVVIGVPETSLPCALGYAEQSGIPYEMGLNKNRYIQRTFIQPDQKLRDKSVKMKLTPIPGVLKGKRVVVIDDSIVRGTTSKPIVELLFEAGAKEVHFLVSSPPIRFPDFYGIDTPAQSNLLAYGKTVEEMRQYLGATSLYFLSVDGMLASTGLPKDHFNTSPFTGEYPIDLKERYEEFNYPSKVEGVPVAEKI